MTQNDGKLLLKITQGDKVCLIAEVQANPLTELIEYTKTVWIFRVDTAPLYSTLYLDELPLFTIRYQDGTMTYLSGTLTDFMEILFPRLLDGWQKPAWQLQGSLVLLMLSKNEWTIVDTEDTHVTASIGSFADVMNDYLRVLI